MSISENTLVFTHLFDEPVKMSIEGDRLTIGSLVIEAEHEQDFCEHVYADFTVFESYTRGLNASGVCKLEIKAVEDMGLLFFFYGVEYLYGEPKRTGVLVNCYNEQNGYYSSDLSLVITNGEKKEVIDVSNVVYDMVEQHTSLYSLPHSLCQ